MGKTSERIVVRVQLLQQDGTIVGALINTRDGKTKVTVPASRALLQRMAGAVVAHFRAQLEHGVVEIEDLLPDQGW